MHPTSPIVPIPLMHLVQTSFTGRAVKVRTECATILPQVAAQSKQGGTLSNLSYLVMRPAGVVLRFVCQPKVTAAYLASHPGPYKYCRRLHRVSSCQQLQPYARRFDLNARVIACSFITGDYSQVPLDVRRLRAHDARQPVAYMWVWRSRAARRQKLP